jgi:hypothetical protein
MENNFFPFVKNMVLLLLNNKEHMTFLKSQLFANACGTILYLYLLIKFSGY